ncbi:MAG: hypothetical protein E6K08_08210 [Methanobacteriota archaeon]|nr:MAG: hypothetical protein E6K08_08210 [Euryarchaeota archaeon]
MMVNPSEALEAINRERVNQEWINKSLPSLRRKFGDRYIAVRARKVIDSDKDFEKLLARVRKLSDSGSVTIEYVTALEYLWLL